MSRKLTRKQLNQLKYDGVVTEINEEENNDIVRERTKSAKNRFAETIKNSFFGTLLESKDTSSEDSITPQGEERLDIIAKQKLRVAQELMRRWKKTEASDKE